MPNLGRPQFGTPRRGGTLALLRGRVAAAWSRLAVALCCIGVGLALPACTTATFIVQQYDGAPLPGSKIAILRILGGGDSFIAALDGEQLGFKLDDPRDRIHVEMLPGRHLISLGRVDDDRVVTRAFEARPSVTYRAVVLPSRLVRDAYGRPTWTVGVFEIDPNSDELGKDVSQGPELPPPSAPPSAPSAATTSAPNTGAPNTGAPSSAAPIPSTPAPSTSANDGAAAPGAPPAPPAPSTSGSGAPTAGPSSPPPAGVSSPPAVPPVSPVNPVSSASPAVNPVSPAPPAASSAAAQPPTPPVAPTVVPKAGAKP